MRVHVLMIHRFVDEAFEVLDDTLTLTERDSHGALPEGVPIAQESWLRAALHHAARSLPAGARATRPRPGCTP